MDVIESVKHGLVFYVFGLAAIYMIFGFTLTLDPTGTYEALINNIATLQLLVGAIPFFLMGFFEKMFD